MKCKSTTIKKPLVVVLCFDRTKKVSLSSKINIAFLAYNILSCNNCHSSACQIKNSKQGINPLHICPLVSKTQFFIDLKQSTFLNMPP